MTSGEKIKKYRKEAGLTQAELARRMHVSQPVIAQYEKGVRVAKIETLKKFAEVLNIPYYWLLADDLLENAEKGIEFDNLVDSLIRDLEKENGINFHIEGKKFDNYESFLAYTEIKGLDEKKREIIKLLNMLNKSGLNEAKRQIEILVQIPRYTEYVKNDPVNPDQAGTDTSDT